MKNTGIGNISSKRSKGFNMNEKSDKVREKLLNNKNGCGQDA